MIFLNGSIPHIQIRCRRSDSAQDVKQNNIMDIEMKNHIKLYKIDSKRNMRYWEIYNDKSLICIEHGIRGGSPNYETERVEFGLAGRSQEEQILSRINSRANKKMDAGYFDSIEKAELFKMRNKLGLHKPMLAARYDKIEDFKFDCNYVQHKYDGHRCLIKNDNGNIVAYSRNGKIINSISHITDELKGVIPEGGTLDGELYHHGTKLQTIGSWVRRKQQQTLLLKFICYDIIMDSCYSERLSAIVDLSLNKLENSELSHTDMIIGEFLIAPLLERSRGIGYEGLIIRPAGHPYEPGKRSKGLIKVKDWLDDEYTVAGITLGVDGQAMLSLRHNGKSFKATSPGTQMQKIYIGLNKDKFIGKKVTVQYANLTDAGIPFQPVATMWRDKEGE